MRDVFTISEARDWLRKRLDRGAACPVCTQHAQVYRRTINAGMARSLIAMYRVGGTAWVHVPTQVGARSREEGKLAYWGLVEEAKHPRANGSRAGWWRVTEKGERFVHDELVLPRYARVFNGRCLGLTGEPVGIRQALGKRFDYRELMGG